MILRSLLRPQSALQASIKNLGRRQILPQRGGRNAGLVDSLAGVGVCPSIPVPLKMALYGHC
jgi:hypothetical protein